MRKIVIRIWRNVNVEDDLEISILTYFTDGSFSSDFFISTKSILAIRFPDEADPSAKHFSIEVFQIGSYIL